MQILGMLEPFDMAGAGAYAVEAGAAVLKKGGSAVDAAIATQATSTKIRWSNDQPAMAAKASFKRVTKSRSCGIG